MSEHQLPKGLVSRRAILAGVAAGPIGANPQLSNATPINAERSRSLSKSELGARLDSHELWLKDPAIGERLSASDLSVHGPFAIVGYDLTLADLRRCNLEGATFDGIELKNTDLEGANLKATTFTNCRAIGVNLSSACLDGARFENCCWLASNFRGASLRGVHVTQSNPGGDEIPFEPPRHVIDLSAYNGTPYSPSSAPAFQFCDFSRCILDDAVLGTWSEDASSSAPILKLTDSVMDGASMRRVTIQNAEIENASFEHTIIAGTTLGPRLAIKTSYMNDLDISDATIIVDEVAMLVMMMAIAHSAGHTNPYGFSIIGAMLHMNADLTSCSDEAVLLAISQLPYQFQNSRTYADVLGSVFRSRDLSPAVVSLDAIALGSPRMSMAEFR